MEIFIIPCLKDNYAYVVRSAGVNYLIDAPEAAPIIDFFAQHEDFGPLNYILNTHHHWDHTDGNSELKEHFNCQIVGYAPDAHRIPGIDIQLANQGLFQPADLGFKCISATGHTLGHVVYYLEREKILFSGDTLFAMGCGRLFEGTAAQMWETLGELKRLPDDVKIYAGHEYAQKNAEFTMQYATNPEVESRYREIQQLRKANLPTVPFTVEQERQTNPFFRATSLDEFIHLRELRNRW